jgi:hypothetical protein
VAVPDFAETELEYLVILTRSVFDLLQEAISLMWENHVLLLDPEQERLRKQRSLPDTFSRIVLVEKQQARTAAQIETKFGVSPTLAAAYEQVTPFFFELRRFRDRIVHSNGGSGRIYVTERGFCVSNDSTIYRQFGGWSVDHRYNENLVSVLPWMAHVILRTIGACNHLTEAFVRTITPQPPIAPGYRVFVRGPATDALINVLDVFQGGSSWWDAQNVEEKAVHAHQRIKERAYYLSKHRAADAAGNAMADWLVAEQIERG